MKLFFFVLLFLINFSVKSQSIPSRLDTSFVFSISFDSTYLYGDSSFRFVFTSFKNNTKDTVYFVEDNRADEKYIVDPNSFFTPAPYYLWKPLAVKSKIPPNGEYKRNFIIGNFQHFHNKFRMGFIFIQASKNDKIQLKYKQFRKKKFVIWSNEL